MSDVWVGVIGGAVGGFFTALVSLATPWISWSVKARELDKVHDTEQERAKLEHRRELVREWREGMFEARRDWLAAERRIQEQLEARGSATGDFEFLDGRAWFESLRPQLTLTPEEINGLSWHFDEDNLKTLSAEVARIEREWKLV
ncbi:hypothetical protein R1X32_17120 [Rhodococcus opacus]|uniref:hypothetical protein n=1 Tax=Rhodococcus opacus TaxID=37919 RepID=UPI0013DE9C4E|nr:hypothetical protein [Rhodococcus opacus]WKN58392.1 hypothetical protein HJ581_0034005 [Rhodococcus opacus]